MRKPYVPHEVTDAEYEQIHKLVLSWAQLASNFGRSQRRITRQMIREAHRQVTGRAVDDLRARFIANDITNDERRRRCPTN